MTDANDASCKPLQTVEEVAEYLSADGQLTDAHLENPRFREAMKTPELLRAALEILHDRVMDGDISACRFVAARERETLETLQPVRQICMSPESFEPRSQGMENWTKRWESLHQLNRSTVDEGKDPKDMAEYIYNLGLHAMCLARMLSCREGEVYKTHAEDLKYLAAKYRNAREKYLDKLEPVDRSVIEHVNKNLLAALDGKNPFEDEGSSLAPDFPEVDPAWNIPETEDPYEKPLKTVGDVEKFLYADPMQTEERLWSSFFQGYMVSEKLRPASFKLIRERAEAGDVPSCRYLSARLQDDFRLRFPGVPDCDAPADFDPLSAEMKKWTGRWEDIHKLDRIAAEKSGDPRDKAGCLIDLGRHILWLIRVLNRCDGRSKAYGPHFQALNDLIGEYEAGKAGCLEEIPPNDREMIEMFDWTICEAYGKNPYEEEN